MSVTVHQQFSVCPEAQMACSFTSRKIYLKNSNNATLTARMIERLAQNCYKNQQSVGNNVEETQFSSSKESIQSWGQKFRKGSGDEGPPLCPIRFQNVRKGPLMGVAVSYGWSPNTEAWLQPQKLHNFATQASNLKLRFKQNARNNTSLYFTQTRINRQGKLLAAHETVLVSASIAGGNVYVTMLLTSNLLLWFWTLISHSEQAPTKILHSRSSN
jgi:hypothetical protein